MSVTIEIGELEAKLEDGAWTIVSAPDPKIARAVQAGLATLSRAYRPASGEYVPSWELAAAQFAADVMGGTVVEHVQEPIEPDGIY